MFFRPQAGVVLAQPGHLRLKDLLQGENHTSGIGNLTSYLHFTQNGSDTTAHVSASGSFANTTAGDTVDIVLKGVSLADLGGGLGHTSDTQIIQNLLHLLTRVINLIGVLQLFLNSIQPFLCPFGSFRR